MKESKGNYKGNLYNDSQEVCRNFGEIFREISGENFE